jgi:hypothetical protein
MVIEFYRRISRNINMKKLVAALIVALSVSAIVYGLEKILPYKTEYNEWIFFRADHNQVHQLKLSTTDKSKIKIPLEFRKKLTDCSKFSSEILCRIELYEEKSFYNLVIITRSRSLSEEIRAYYSANLQDLWIEALKIPPNHQNGFRFEASYRSFEQGLERSRDILPLVAFFYTFLIYSLVMGRKKI